MMNISVKIDFAYPVRGHVTLMLIVPKARTKWDVKVMNSFTYYSTFL
jgi:hypothetical protein